MEIKSQYITIFNKRKEIRRIIREAQIGIYASGAAFFLFLSIIPIVIIVSGLLPVQTIISNDTVNLSQAVVPEKIYLFLTGIAQGYHGNNLTLLSVSAIIILWSASRGMLSLIRGLNHIYGVEEEKNYFLIRLKAIFYTIFLLMAIIMSVGVLILGNTIAEWVFADNKVLSSLWRMVGTLRHIFVAFLISILFCTMYYILPNNQLEWKKHYLGAVCTSVFWTLYSFLFSVYIEYFEGFSMYGSLTTIVMVMFWLYFCMYIFFFGALVNKFLVEGYCCADSN